MPKILIVDDDPNVALLVKMTLSKQDGYSLEISESGDKALERINEDPPDLVLLDLMMPGIDGMEVCRRIKSNEETKFIPVLMLTAKREAADMILGMEVGANDYITKPFNPEELVARVRVHLRIKALEKEAGARSELETALEMSVTLQHQINNPLTGVVGNIELLKEWDKLSKKDIDEIVESALVSALRIKDIVKRMGKLTRVISTPYIGGQKMIDFERSLEKPEE